MSNHSSGWFGIKPPETASVAWGARAILNKNGIYIPRDRMQWKDYKLGSGDNVDAVNKIIKELQRRVQEKPPNPMMNKEHSFKLDGWECRYNTRRSMGYLYIGIFKEG